MLNCWVEKLLSENKTIAEWIFHCYTRPQSPVIVPCFTWRATFNLSLYCGYGLGCDFVKEHFQWSPSMITKWVLIRYFKQILHALMTPPSTSHMCGSLLSVCPLCPKYKIHSSFIPFTIVCWVLSMAPTSPVLHLLWDIMWQRTARVNSYKTALLYVPLTFASHILCPVETDPSITLLCLIRPAEEIFTSLRGGITLQTLALPH